MIDDERFPIPHGYDPDHQARRTAIAAKLKPIADSPAVRTIEVAYWREGEERPLSRWVCDARWVWPGVLEGAPIAATHISVRELGTRSTG